jgi:hypothetical protein
MHSNLLLSCLTWHKVGLSAYVHQEGANTGTGTEDHGSRSVWVKIL